MWDPISIFYCMWVLNSAELPNSRLSVDDIIKQKENTVIAESVKLRDASN